MPSELWTRMRSRKREEGWDKEGQVVLLNTVLMHSLRSGFSVVRSRGVLISDDLSPWKAAFLPDFS